MTLYPSIGSYDFAVSYLNQFILAPQFSGGSPIFTKQKQILGYSGGYSVVYPIKVNGKKIALRCWIKDPGNVKERYARVKPYLLAHPTRYFVDFDYIDNGIVVDGNKYPISYMEWIDGKTFSQFLDENISNTTIITELANHFLFMVKELHSKSISHGDLQDGNIIVSHNTTAIDIKLVDYDCIYTPTLQDWNNQDDLQGVPNYQHPKRYQKSNEKADYFSELVIYLSLLAYTERPSLWEKDQEKRLLFTADDFKNPSASIAFKTLETLSLRVKNLSNKLKKFCYENNTNQLSPLEEVISGNSASISEDDLKEFFGSSAPIPRPSKSPSHSPSQSPNQDLSQFFESVSPKPTSSPRQPIPVSQSKKAPRLAPFLVMAIIIIIILGLFTLGALVISAINTQNAKYTQTRIAQNAQSTKTVIAQNAQSTQKAIDKNETAIAWAATPLYTQTFDYAPEWEWDNDEDAKFVVEYGHIKGQVKGQIAAWTLAGKSFHDIKIDVDIEKLGGSDSNEIGVFCNATDTRHFYALVFGSDRSYSIWQQDGDNSTSLVDWQYSSAINSGNATNHLTSVCNSGHLSLLVNDIELISVYDTSYLHGDVGIIIGSFDKNTTVSAYFDNFYVSNP